MTAARWLFGAALALGPGVALAQGPADVATPPRADATPAPPEEVTVAGTKEAQTSGSAHVVRAKQLERFSYDDPHAVLLSVPGVYVRGEDGFGLRPNIGMRGVSSDRSKKLTLMEDGVLFGPAPYSAPAAYFFPMITRMQRVRVVKGPATISYGPHTVGGAIDLVTPDIPDARRGTIDLAGGEYGYAKAHVTYGASGDDHGFLLDGLHLASDGFKVLDGGGDTGFYRNEWMAKARFAPIPTGPVSHVFDVKLGYADERSDETYLGLTDADFKANPYRRYRSTVNDRMTNRRTSIVVAHTVALAPGLSVKTTVYRHDYARVWRKVNGVRGATLQDMLRSPDTATAKSYLAHLRGETDGTPDDAILIGPNDRSFVSEGAQTVARFRATTGPVRHRIEAGLRLHFDATRRVHTEEGFMFQGTELVPDGRGITRTADNYASALALAAHVVDVMDLGRVTLTPGVRTESILQRYENRLGRTYVTSGTQQVVLPGVGVFVALPHHVGLLAGVHRGFSPAPPGPDRASPERSTAYEAGVRFAPRDLRVEAIGFWSEYQNLTNVCTFAEGCTGGNQDTSTSAGRARTRGVEVYAESERKISASVALPARLAYTYTQARFLSSFSSDDPVFGDVTKGDEIPYVPAHQLALSAGVETPRARIDLGGTHVSRMRETAGRGAPAPGDATDAYFVLDASGSVRVAGSLRVYVNVRNVLDTVYVASRRPFGARPGAPRWVQLGLKATF